MTLPSPDLDDRRFQDIVDEAKRLIPTYCPEWTNHNLSDPGIALIELFAWMTEMTLYRLNQVPDRFYTKFLELVGIELFPSSSAGTDLTFWLSAPSAQTLVVPGGTQVGTAPGRTTSPVVFMTDDDLRIIQPRLFAFLTSSGPGHFQNVWDDLKFGREGVACFISDPLVAGDAFYLGFRGSLAGNIIRLDVAATVEGLGVDPLRPPLRWETWTGESWARARVHADETGGLNQDGAITLLIPPIHAPLTLGEQRAYWLRGRLDDPDDDEPPYQASPELRSVRVSSLGGSVMAHHAEPAPAEAVGHSDGTAGQVFHLRNRPVLPRRDGEEVVVTGQTEGVAWEEVEDFSNSGPEDRHVVWDATDGDIRFGPSIRYPDGTVHQHGAIPAQGALIGVSGYRFGGGATGNVGAGTLTVMNTTIPYIDHVENLRAATGGVDPETADNAKLRAPTSIRTGQRAVTAADYERLTLEASPRVARARCLPATEPGAPVRVLVVPHVAKAPADAELDDFALEADLVETITAHLDERRTLGTSVEIGTPYYQGITVATRLKALPGRPPDLVRQRALDVLYRYFNPLVGGLRGSGWEFEEDAGAAPIFELLDAVEGVDRVDDVLLFEADLRNRDRVGRGKELVRLSPDCLFLSFSHRVVVR
ncbi:MAG: putative baseplate assembly protein [Acidimicrobiales bacterium]